MTKATVIVTQRERFGMTEESLDNLYENTTEAFDVVYVDGNSPKKTKDFLAGAALERGFELIRKDHYLTPNQARNIGWRAAGTDYVVFADNDVLYTPGWLDALVRCAEETGADVVAPLTCHALPAHTTIHHAGGGYTMPDGLSAFHASTDGQRPFDETMEGHNEKVADWQTAGKLTRQQTQTCEFHCVLVRRAALERIGGLDEKMLSTKEHLDLCMSIHASGGTVWFEPASVVTYVMPNRDRPLESADWPFFALRWSDDYGRRSLDHFFTKWNLDVPEGYLEQRKATYRWRRIQAILVPMMRRVPGINRNKGLTLFAARVAGIAERQVNKRLVARQGRLS